MLYINKLSSILLCVFMICRCAQKDNNVKQKTTTTCSRYIYMSWTSFNRPYMIIFYLSSQDKQTHTIQRAWTLFHDFLLSFFLENSYLFFILKNNCYVILWLVNLSTKYRVFVALMTVNLRKKNTAKIYVIWYEWPVYLSERVAINL